MINEILEFIINNKEWLFSGIGVVAISIVVSFFSNHLFNKRRQKDDRFAYVAKDTRELTLESCLLLIYAAADNESIIRARALSGRIIVSTRKRTFMKDASPRESAIWQDAVDILLEDGFIRLERKNAEFEMYGLTGEGYKKGEELKVSMNVDTSKEPLEELKKYWV